MRLITPRPAPSALAVRSCLLAAVLALGLAAPAAAKKTSPAPKEATEWLASQLQRPGEGAYCELFGEESVGETIECSLAFKAAGSSFATQREETYRWALANKSRYVGSEPCATASKPLSAGAVAKLALGVEANGGDPEDVEGRNLIADLECLQVGSGSEAGRFSDKNQPNYSDVSGQSLAIVALKACEAGCASKPNLKASIEAGAAYLVKQQCAGSKPKSLNGAFRSTMGLSASTCNGEPPFGEESENENAVEVDSTGTAVQALLVAATAEAKTAARAAVKWLKKERKKSRYWENYCSFSESSAPFASVNSTALAMMAYVEDSVSLGQSQKWLDGIAEAQPAHEQGLPACTEAGPPEVLATAQGLLGMYATTYPRLVGLP